MSRNSCIQHAEQQALAIVRQDYYELMNRDAVAAALLNIFEYWANGVLSSKSTEDRPWVGPRPIREFEQRLLGIATDKQIRKRLSLLVERGFIQMKRSACRGVATAYRLMVPEVQAALRRLRGAGQMTEDGADRTPNDQRSIGRITRGAAVKQPNVLRSNDQALKKDLKDFKEEKERKGICSSFELSQLDDDAEQMSDRRAAAKPVQVGGVRYVQPPEAIDLASLWEESPQLAKRKLRRLAPGHRRLEMVAHGFGHWWVGPKLNGFDPQLVQACQQRKRKFQQSDSEADAKTYINNMIRSGDWANLALRCEEAKALKRRATEVKQAEARATQPQQPFVWPEQERKASALGLMRFKLKRGDVEGARAIAQQFGLKPTDNGQIADKPIFTVA